MYWDWNIENYQTNTTKLTFSRMIVPVHATDYVFNILYVNRNAKNVDLLFQNVRAYAEAQGQNKAVRKCASLKWSMYVC